MKLQFIFETKLNFDSVPEIILFFEQALEWAFEGRHQVGS